MGASSGTDLSLYKLLSVVRSGWCLIAPCVGVCVALAVAYLHVVEHTYTISLQISPIDSTPSLSTSLGGFADLVGLGGQSSPNFSLYKASLQSSLAAEAITKNTELMHLMFYGAWSDKDKRWKQPQPSWIGTIVGAAASVILHSPPKVWHEPSVGEVQAFLLQQMTVTTERSTQIIKLSMQWHDPVMGQKILAGICATTDQALRKRDLIRAEEYVRYASQELAQSGFVEYREALAQLFVQQERRRMIATVNLPFAGQALGSPIASSRPTHPKSAVTVLLSIPIGFFGGLALAYYQIMFGWNFDVWSLFKKKFAGRREFKESGVDGSQLVARPRPLSDRPH